MTKSDMQRQTIYDYLVATFPERKAPPNFVMTQFEKQVRKDIPEVSMSYGFIACQTKLYLYDGWIHKSKEGTSYGNAGAYVPKLKHSAAPMLTNVDGEAQDDKDGDEPETELELQTFDPMDALDINHYRTGKIIDEMLSTFNDEGGMMSTINFQVMGASGTGKTLLMMCMSRDFKDQKPDMNILHVNSEMTEVLMQAYIKKAPDLSGIDLVLLRKYHPDKWAEVFVKAFNKKRWDIIILDSFQDLVVKLQDSLGMNSSKTEAWLVNLMSEMNNRCGTSFFVLNHVNKDGSAAGKSYLKHILDGMLEIHRDDHDKHQRFVTFSKNRVGVEQTPMYYDILRAGDDRGFKGEVVWDVERYRRIDEQKQFAERNKQHVEQDLNRFATANYGEDSEDQFS